MDKHATFSRTDTRVIKGAAILMMLMHHLWGFDKRIPTGLEFLHPALRFTINKQMPFHEIGQFCKLCVPVFMFLSGYGSFEQIRKGTFSFWRRLKTLYFSYWKVFFVFVPVGFLFFANQPAYMKAKMYNRFAEFHLVDFIRGICGLSTKYNEEWWFLFAYVIALFLGCLYVRWTRRIQNPGTELFIIIVIQLALVHFLPALPEAAAFPKLGKDVLFTRIFREDVSFTAFLIGTVFAKYNVMNQLKRMVQRLRLIPRLLLVLAGGGDAPVPAAGVYGKCL